MNENGYNNYNNYANNNYANNGYGSYPQQDGYGRAQSPYGGWPMQSGQQVPYDQLPQQTPFYGYGVTEPKSRKPLLIILVSVGAVLIAGLAVLVLFLAGKLGDSSNAAPADTGGAIVIEETADAADDTAADTADAADDTAAGNTAAAGNTENAAADTAAADDTADTAAAEEPAQEGLTWTLEDHVLTISGSGDMNTLADSDGYTYPWVYVEEEITEVVIEDGVTTVGEWAFANMGGLAKVTIPDSVTEICNNAFDFCWVLSGVEIPDGVTRIGSCAFEYCVCLTEVTIPDGVTEIGDGAFNGCSGLTTITIPAGVTAIGESAFTACGSLAEVHYIGSESDWNAIDIDSGNEQLTGANISFG